MLAVSEPESDVFTSLRIAVAPRLVYKICMEYRCVCGDWVDELGRHGLYCVRSAGRFSRHHVRRALVSANIPSVLEPPGLVCTEGKRPDGFALVPSERGRGFLWDTTCACVPRSDHLPQPKPDGHYNALLRVAFFFHVLQLYREMVVLA